MDKKRKPFIPRKPKDGMDLFCMSMVTVMFVSLAGMSEIDSPAFVIFGVLGIMVGLITIIEIMVIASHNT